MATSKPTEYRVQAMAVEVDQSGVAVQKWATVVVTREMLEDAPISAVTAVIEMLDRGLGVNS